MTNCLNCGAAIETPYCGQCGQKHVGHRLNMPELVSNAFAAVTELDSSLWRTLKGVAVDPGRVALDYIGGKRAYYLNPVKFFLTAFAIYVAAMSATGLLDQIAQEAVHFGEGTDLTTKPARAALAFQEVLRHHFNLLFFVTLPLMAFCLRWQFWRSGRNYAETLSFLCYVVGMSSLYALIFVLGYYLFDFYTNAIRGGVMLLLFAIGARSFFAMSWLKAILSLAVSLLLYFLCTSIAGIVLAFIKMAGYL